MNTENIVTVEAMIKREFYIVDVLNRIKNSFVECSGIFSPKKANKALQVIQGLGIYGLDNRGNEFIIYLDIHDYQTFIYEGKNKCLPGIDTREILRLYKSDITTNGKLDAKKIITYISMEIDILIKRAQQTLTDLKNINDIRKVYAEIQNLHKGLHIAKASDPHYAGCRAYKALSTVVGEFENGISWMVKTYCELRRENHENSTPIMLDEFKNILEYQHQFFHSKIGSIEKLDIMTDELEQIIDNHLSTTSLHFKNTFVSTNGLHRSKKI